jgi:acetyl esterase/lipase
MRELLSNWRLTACCVSVLLTGLAAQSQSQESIPLWPAAALAVKGYSGEETNIPSTNKVDNRPFNQLGNVVNPRMTIFRPPEGKASGAAVLVFPGGSYRILADDMEGSEICQWLSSLGITGILVRYRVPPLPGKQRYADPLEDAQRALGMVRSRAAEWHLDPARIGVMGFSAGGHLATLMSNHFDQRTYAPIDEAERVSCRPDFTILIYPAFLTNRDDPAGQLVAEFHVTAQAPPAFIVQTEDDPVRVQNSLFYYLALVNVKVPAEMHLFSKGGHGYGMRATGAPVAAWPKYAEVWLKSMGAIH